MFCRNLLAIMSMLLFSECSSAEKPKTDKQMMQGAWEVTSLRHRGTTNVSNIAEGDYVFADEELRVTIPSRETVAKLTFRPEKKPKQLEMKVVSGVGAGKTVFCIYRFKDEKLILCMGYTQPEEFTGDGEAGLLTLERPKKNEQ